MSSSITLGACTAPTAASADLPQQAAAATFEAHPHYALVASAITVLARRARPSLGVLAASLGVSESHLQRTFTEWAGVSPKRFVQFISKERALAALNEANDVLDAALTAGLSSPGRMHDMLVTCEGVTPGEVRALGRDLVIRHGVAATWFGTALVGLTERGICHLRFIDDVPADAALDEFRRQWPLARFVTDPAAAEAALAALRRPHLAPSPPIRVWLKGTNFQIKVWEALMRIPEGRLLSYSEVARAAGMGNAVRAVASAVAANSVAIWVPCHRVIRSSGVLGQYRWGAARKAALIGWEAAQCDRRAMRAG
jgi:AraC family transcriptional regulator, regulatory protein of adaptative response / methylated-DNA-[protein]-cysteine methyltransferase